MKQEYLSQELRKVARAVQAFDRFPPNKLEWLFLLPPVACLLASSTPSPLHALVPPSPILNNPVSETLQLQRWQTMWIHTAGPGMVPAHNHLSCVLIPAMVKAHYFQPVPTAPLSVLSSLNTVALELVWAWLARLPMSAGVKGGG